MMNMFEKATKNKTRFPSVRGDLMVEQLWDLPLTSRNELNLDTIAKTVNAELKSETEESFVSIRPNSRKVVLEHKLEILKHIIDVKIKQAEANDKAAANATKREKLLRILERKQDENLESMTPEEIAKELEELSNN